MNKPLAFLASLVLCMCAYQDTHTGCKTPDVSHMPLGVPFEEALSRLRVLCPLGFEDVTTREEGPLFDEEGVTVFGYSDWSEDLQKFLFVVDSRACDVVEVETLAHEWAHGLLWDACLESDHGPLWGVAYARCHRAVYDVD